MPGMGQRWPQWPAAPTLQDLILFEGLSPRHRKPWARSGILQPLLTQAHGARRERSGSIGLNAADGDRVAGATGRRRAIVG